MFMTESQIMFKIMLVLDQFWLHFSERTAQELSIAFSRPHTHNLCDIGTFQEKCGISLNSTFDDLAIDLGENMNDVTSPVIVAAYRMSFTASSYHSWFPK